MHLISRGSHVGCLTLYKTMALAKILHNYPTSAYEILAAISVIATRSASSVLR
jgi:hypothetical protein